jgi:streptogramin lyase
VLVADDEPSAPRAATATPTATPAAPRVTGTVADVGHRPRDVAVAGGDVWVLSYTRERIARIDARTLEREDLEPRVGTGAWAIAGDDDAVWVAIPRQGRVLRIDARTGRPAGSIRTPLTPVAVATGQDALWIVGRHPRGQPGTDKVYRYDRDGRRRATIRVPLEVSAIAPAGRGVWIAVTLQPRVLRYAPDGRELRNVRVTAPASEIAFGGGSVWASLPSVDAVAQVPPGRPSVSSSTARNPSELAVADGYVFVTGNTDHTVAVLDAKSGRPAGDEVPVGLNPFAVAAGNGAVWVTGMGDNSVTRISF